MRSLRSFGAVALLTLLVVLLPYATSAKTSTTSQTDRQILEHVEKELAETDINLMNVKVRVDNGVVTLSGAVPSLWAKEELIEEASKVDGVRSVVSELTVSAGEDDRVIGEQVAERIRQYVFYTIYDDVNIEVNDGVVTLTGRVTMPYKADAIADLVARVKGVREVRNQIQTLPVSRFDDELRTSIARQIYGDPMFWNYAIQVNPPIHIIVENGRVRLTGVVSSEVERRKAEVIARGTFGVLGVENDLRVEGRQSSTS